MPSIRIHTRQGAHLRSLHPGPMREDYFLTPGGQVLGRDGEQANLIQAGPDVSRRHAWIGRDEEGDWVLRDLDSHNGSFVNGERIDDSRHLAAGDVIGLGRSRSPDFEFLLSSDGHQRRLRLKGSGPWTIGRGMEQAVSLPADLSVSQRHGRIERHGDQLKVVDLNSLNGIWRGRNRARELLLPPGACFMIGHHRVCWQAQACGAVELQLTSLSQAIGLRLEGWRLKNQGSEGPIELAAGQLHRLYIRDAIGRERLLHCLGRGHLIDGACFSQDWLAEQVERQRDRVALIDDYEALPKATRLGQWLEEEARLRLDTALSRTEIEALITTTLEALGLQDRRRARLDALSALEAALTRLAAGLLTRPGLALIDIGDVDLDASDQRSRLDRLERLTGAELTLVIIGARGGLPVVPRPSGAPEGPSLQTRVSPLSDRKGRRPKKENSRLRSAQTIRAPSVRVTACLLQRGLRALWQQPGMLASLIAVPLVLMLSMVFWLSVQSTILAAQITLLISSPLAALALGPAWVAMDRSPVHRFGLLPDLAVAQGLIAAGIVMLLFLLVSTLAIGLLPLPVWSLASGMQLLLAGAAGMSLGLMLDVASRGHRRMALMGVTLVGSCQAAWIIQTQPGAIELLVLALLGTGLMVFLKRRQHKISIAGDEIRPQSTST